MKKLLVLCLITGSSLLGHIAGLQADDKGPPPAEKHEKKNQRYVPFHGKVDTLDKVAGTLKVGERTFHVTPETKITKGGKPASFQDATVGEEVGGAFQLGDSGHLELTSLRIGPKPPKDGKHEEQKP